MTRGQRILLWIAGLLAVLIGFYLMDEDNVFMAAVFWGAGVFALYRVLGAR